MTKGRGASANSLVVSGLAILVVVLGFIFFVGRNGDAIDAAVETVLDDGVAGAVVLIGSAGEEPEVRIYGNAGGGAPESLSPDSQFRIASLTKPVTSAAINELVAAGSIALDDQLGDLLPDIEFADAALASATVHDLLRHTSGIDEGADISPLFLSPELVRSELGVDPADVDCRAIGEAMAGRSLTHAPSIRTVYSNTGYCYLGLILESQTGLDLEQAYHSLVPESLNFTMDPSALTFQPDVPQDQQDFAVMKPAAAGAAGGLIASPRDYYRFMARPVADRVTEAPPFPVEATSYWGMGWRVWPDLACPERTHVGSLPGAYTIAMIDDRENVLVAFFAGRPSQDWEPFIEVVSAGCQLFDE